MENAIPTTTLLLQLDQVMTQRALTYHVNWLEARYVVTRVEVCSLLLNDLWMDHITC